MLPLLFNLKNIIANIDKFRPTVRTYHKGVLDDNLVSSRYFFKVHPKVDPVFMLSVILPREILSQRHKAYGVYFDHTNAINFIEAVFKRKVKKSVNIQKLKDDYKLIYLIGRTDIEVSVLKNTMEIVRALSLITLSMQSLEMTSEELYVGDDIIFTMQRAFDFEHNTPSSISELFIHAFDSSYLSSGTRKAVLRHKNGTMYACFKKHTLFIADSNFDRSLIGHFMKNSRRLRPKRELAISDLKIPFMLVLKREGHENVIQDIFLEKDAVVRDENKKHFELWVDENYINSITSKQLKKSIGEYLKNMKDVGIELKNVEDISYKFSEDLVKPPEMTPFTPLSVFIEQNEEEKLKFYEFFKKHCIQWKIPI